MQKDVCPVRQICPFKAVSQLTRNSVVICKMVSDDDGDATWRETISVTPHLVGTTGKTGNSPFHQLCQNLIFTDQ